MDKYTYIELPGQSILSLYSAAENVFLLYLILVGWSEVKILATDVDDILRVNDIWPCTWAKANMNMLNFNSDDILHVLT